MMDAVPHIRKNTHWPPNTGAAKVIPGAVWCDESFISVASSKRLFVELQEGVNWVQHRIKIFGKSHPCPRLSAWYGDSGSDYAYSGLSLNPIPWSKTLLEIKSVVEERVGTSFNSALLNLYRDGNDSMGWHSDDESELGEQPVIASVSLGDTRRFLLRLRIKSSAQKSVSIDLHSGSLLVMRGNCQKEWKHSVPKTIREVGPRINLTFRRIVVAQL